MDRSKPRGGKGNKSHQPFPGSGELIALGNKGNRPAGGSGPELPEIRKLPTTSVSKSSATSSKTSTGKSSGGSSSSSSKSSDRKRENSSTSSVAGSPSPHIIPPKKSRLAPVGSSSGGGSSSSSTGSSSSLSKSSSSSSQIKSSKTAVKRERDPLSISEVDIAINDLSPENIFSVFEQADKSRDTDHINSLISTIVNRLKSNKEKPELNLGVTLMVASKLYPYFFHNSNAIEAVCSLAKRYGPDLKAKIPQINHFSPLAVNILSCSHRDAQPWPVSFVQLWIEDASTDRLWVDSVHCKSFVENIIVSFGTKLPASNLLLPPDPSSTASTPTSVVPGSSSPHPLGTGDSESNLQEDIAELLREQAMDSPVLKRFVGLENQIESAVLDYAKELIHKKAPDVPRNLLRALSAACGFPGVRAYVVKLLEQWIHSPKCGRQAQELLLHLCVNAHCHTTEDAEIVTQIPKLRMKTKPLLNFYSISVREMVKDNEGNLRNVLNQIIYNELSPTRNPTNLTLLGTILGHVSESSVVLADIFMDLLQKKEDFLQGLKLLLREIARASRFECDLTLFAQGLMKNRDINWREGDVRERTFFSVADLVLCSMFLSVSGQVREAAVVRGDSKDLGVLTIFHKQIANLQQEAILWLHSVALKMYRPMKKEFMVAINKVLLKDPMNELVSKDGWPAESEKSLFVRLCLEAPLQENTLSWLMQMGLSKEHPCASSEIIELVDHIICRAATHKAAIVLSNLEIIDMLFKLCQYKHPENITLPSGYEPPKLAISKYYWRVWIMLTILCAHNPVSYGKLGWDTYPALKGFMEMCMTNHFTYPTASCSDTKDEDHGKEIMIAAMEKQNILAFETHLAAASSKTVITEKTSLLLAQLMNLDPFGASRTPPAPILAQLQASNDQMHLGHLLCRSRNPDFLLDLIQRNSQPMPWLSELVSEGSFEILPVQCLCEFMLGQTDRMIKAVASEIPEAVGGTVEKSPRKAVKILPESNKEDLKSLQLLQYLQKVVHGTSEDSAREVLEYFLRRLSSQKMISRAQALQGLQMLLSSPGALSEVSWLMDSLPTLRIFPDIQDMVITFLRQAIQIESEPEWITRYLEFLSTWGNLEADSEMDNLAMDVAQLVVERNGVVIALLTSQQKAFDAVFDIFVNYMKRIREPHKETYKWSESQDQVLVQWPKDKLEATMNILVIHAIVILLTSYASFGHKLKAKSGKGKATTELKYTELIDMWFPKTKENTPKGYLLNTSEEAILYPDWIKLRMIRSNNSRLLSAALADLDADQLMLFVQSFGVPVQSMSTLLYCLDKAVEENPETVKSAVMDAPYMHTLIDMQWKRGASCGEQFYGLLKSISAAPEPMDTTATDAGKQQCVRPKLIFSSKSSKKSDLLKPQTALSRKLSFHTTKSSSKSTPEEYLRDSSGETRDIRILSKQLLVLATPPAPRRRSIVSTDSNNQLMMTEDDTKVSSRRYSSHLEQRDDKDSSSVRQTANIGHLVDTITDIEPCIVRNALDVQLPLLFGRQDTTPHCRSFLLSVLTHQAGWGTIEQCINLFLKEFDGSYDPSGILDLISATVTNPKLWQGCDKYVPKHQPNLSIFNLTQPQLLVMSEYIVEEISQLEMKNTKFSISNLLGDSHSVPPRNAKKFKCSLQERVRLWLQCCQQEKDIVDDTIRSLMEKKAKNPCAKKFVSQVYLEFPEVILIDNWKVKADELTLSEDDITCVLDTISHVLITQVANVQAGKDWAKKASHEYDICLRKLAAVHPTLMLRQLPLMGSLLEGRVHLDFSVFYAQNHHIPFLVYLGLLDLMQPYVLKHFKHLKATLILYLKLFTSYGHLKDHSASLSRFSVLLHNFLSVNTKEVKEFLSPHYNSLRELASVKYYLDVTPLQNLMTFLVPPSANSELSVPAPPVSSSDISSFANEATAAIVDRMLHASNDDEMVPILQELDSASNRNPSILSQFAHRLNPLLISTNDSCRTLAFSLILKHVTYYPSASKLYLESILQALQARNAQLKDNLLDRIHEFIIVAQEHADMILVRLFELGVSSNINVLPSITKTLSLLRSCVGIS